MLSIKRSGDKSDIVRGTSFCLAIGGDQKSEKIFAVLLMDLGSVVHPGTKCPCVVAGIAEQ
jgi:hypothetical protein